MDKRKARLISIFKSKCPRCLQSDLFETGAYSLKHSTKMKMECFHCKENFMPEPGFYFGAMYVSYALITGQFIFLFALSHFLSFNLEIWEFIGLFLFIIIALAPLNFRISRVIWLNFFVSYDSRFEKP
jgi:uncharacterized protein (DUF983 family)